MPRSVDAGGAGGSRRAKRYLDNAELHQTPNALSAMSALAACLAYVELKPIRAEIVPTPETSRFTSVFEGILALVGVSVETAVPRSRVGVVCGMAARDGWLSPVGLKHAGLMTLLDAHIAAARAANAPIVSAIVSVNR